MKNDAVLQRTIMIHIINQYWMGSMFDWNTEGQWSLPNDVKLLSRADDDISHPKPDFAISFTHGSFIHGVGKSAAFPQELEKCISPDDVRRCFPSFSWRSKRQAPTCRVHIWPTCTLPARRCTIYTRGWCGPTSRTTSFPPCAFSQSSSTRKTSVCECTAPFALTTDRAQLLSASQNSAPSGPLHQGPGVPPHPLYLAWLC